MRFRLVQRRPAADPSPRIRRQALDGLAGDALRFG